MTVDLTGCQTQPAECPLRCQWRHLQCQQTGGQESVREMSDDWKCHAEILCPLSAKLLNV